MLFRFLFEILHGAGAEEIQALCRLTLAESSSVFGEARSEVDIVIDPAALSLPPLPSQVTPGSGATQEAALDRAAGQMLALFALHSRDGQVEEEREEEEALEAASDAERLQVTAGLAPAQPHPQPQLQP